MLASECLQSVTRLIEDVTRQNFESNAPEPLARRVQGLHQQHFSGFSIYVPTLEDSPALLLPYCAAALDDDSVVRGLRGRQPAAAVVAADW